MYHVGQVTFGLGEIVVSDWNSALCFNKCRRIKLAQRGGV